MGRPKKTVANHLPTGWKKQVIDEMTQGATLEEIQGMFNISDPLHQRWMKDEPEYSATIKQGSMLARQWWLKIGRMYLKDKSFNAVLWYMNMKNRWGWKDRQDVTSGGEKVATITGYVLPKPEEIEK